MSTSRAYADSAAEVVEYLAQGRAAYLEGTRVRFSAEALASVAKAARSARSLRELRLEECDFGVGTEEFGELGHALSEAPALEVLRLSASCKPPLRDECAEALAAGLAAAPRLRRLALMRADGLSAEGVRALMDGMRASRTWRELDVHGIQLDAATSDALVAAARADCLRELVLGEMRGSAVDAWVLARTLVSQTRFRSLHIGLRDHQSLGTVPIMSRRAIVQLQGEVRRIAMANTWLEALHVNGESMTQDLAARPASKILAALYALAEEREGGAGAAAGEEEEPAAPCAMRAFLMRDGDHAILTRVMRMLPPAPPPPTAGIDIQFVPYVARVVYMEHPT